MSQFLTTQGTSFYIEQIIRNARRWLILVTPFLKITTNFYERLLDADKRNVEIALVYGKEDLSPNDKNKLSSLKNLTLKFYKDLHAKCYLNEEHIVITSMNMHEYSQANNREMGVLIQKTDTNDSDVYNDALLEVKSILGSSRHVDLTTSDSTAKPSRPLMRNFSPVQKRTSDSGTWSKIGEGLLNLLNANLIDTKMKSSSSLYKSKGYCLRCGKQITHDLFRPYCKDCYFKWLEWENPKWKEKHCHTCGNSYKSSMLYPQCNSCFQKYH